LEQGLLSEGVLFTFGLVKPVAVFCPSVPAFPRIVLFLPSFCASSIATFLLASNALQFIF
jgi:hypothetical protein